MVEWLLSEWVWVIIGVALAATEPFTPYVMSLPWAAAGLVTAAFVGLFGGGGIGPGEVLCFFGVAGILLSFTLRPLLCYWLYSGKARSNLDKHVGEIVELQAPVHGRSPVLGAVKLFGDSWSALPANPSEVFSRGTHVRVVRVTGNALVVEDPAKAPPREALPEPGLRRWAYIIRKGGNYWIRHSD